MRYEVLGHSEGERELDETKKIGLRSARLDLDVAESSR